jgi:hypothetical protein
MGSRARCPAMPPASLRAADGPASKELSASLARSSDEPGRAVPGFQKCGMASLCPLRGQQQLDDDVSACAALRAAGRLLPRMWLLRRRSALALTVLIEGCGRKGGVRRLHRQMTLRPRPLSPP